MEVFGLPGVMARSKDRWRGHSHLWIHVAARKHSELRSSQSLRIPHKQDGVVRTSRFVASDWCTEEKKARVETRSIPYSGVVEYRSCTKDTCFSTAAAVAASIRVDRAWATSENTGFARSLALVTQPRNSAEDDTSTKHGTSCLLPRTTVTSGVRSLSSEEMLLIRPDALWLCALLEEWFCLPLSLIHI